MISVDRVRVLREGSERKYDPEEKRREEKRREKKRRNVTSRGSLARSNHAIRFVETAVQGPTNRYNEEGQSKLLDQSRGLVTLFDRTSVCCTASVRESSPNSDRVSRRRVSTEPSTDRYTIRHNSDEASRQPCIGDTGSSEEPRTTRRGPRRRRDVAVVWNQPRASRRNSSFVASLARGTIEYGNRSLCNVGWAEK